MNEPTMTNVLTFQLNALDEYQEWLGTIKQRIVSVRLRMALSANLKGALARKPPMNCAKMSYATMSYDDESDNSNIQNLVNSLLIKFPGLKVWPNALQGFVR